MPAPRGPARHPALPLLVAFVLALGVRAAALWWTIGTPLAGDEREYFERALRVASGVAPSASGARAPGTELFFAGVFALFDPSTAVARWANALVGALGVLAIAALARRIGGPSAAWIAGVLAALYPSFVAFSIGVWSEPLYILLAVSAIALLLRDPGAGGALEIGALLAASVLVRESGALFALLALGWWALRAWPEPGRWIPWLAVATLVLGVLPWTLHINRGDEPFAPLTRTTWQNLYIGNAPAAETLGPGGRIVRVEPRIHYYALGETRGEMEQAARTLALDAIRDRLPAWPFEKIAEALPRFFSPASFTQRRILVDPGGPEGEWAYRFGGSEAPRGRRHVRAAALVGLVYAAVAVAGVAGLALLRDRRTAELLWLFLACQLLPCVLAFASTRFRLPSMAILCVGCGLLWSKHRTLGRNRRTLAALTLAAALALLIALQAGHAVDPLWR